VQRAPEVAIRAFIDADSRHAKIYAYSPSFDYAAAIRRHDASPADMPPPRPRAHAIIRWRFCIAALRAYYAAAKIRCRFSLYAMRICVADYAICFLLRHAWRAAAAFDTPLKRAMRCRLIDSMPPQFTRLRR